MSIKLKTVFFQISLLLFFILISPVAQAAEMVAWKSYLLGVMGISLLLASILSFYKPKADSLIGKLLLTGLYFWIFTFAQLIILAFIYYINK